MSNKTKIKIDFAGQANYFAQQYSEAEMSLEDIARNIVRGFTPAEAACLAVLTERALEAALPVSVSDDYAIALQRAAMA